MKCFLTGAPTGSLSRLRQWLQTEATEVCVPFTTFPEPGETVTRALMRVIGNCDFVVAALSNDGPAASLFELGIAVTLGKPVVIIAEAPEILPFDIRDLVCIRAPLNDEKVIRFQLGLFLKDLVAPTTTEPPRERALPNAGPWIESPFLHNLLLNLYSGKAENPGELAEDAVEQSLSVVQYPFQRNLHVRAAGRVYRPDFAVWIDNLTSVNGPLIVEVKASSNPARLHEWTSQLFNYMIATGAGAGILVYVGDEPITELTGWTSDFPTVVLVMELRVFVKRLMDGSIPRMILEERNRRSHATEQQ